MERFRGKYRHEQKFLVDERDIALITARIRPLMEPDAFHPEGAYRIRSVYFDDWQDLALRQNLSGVSPRSKFRIRIYNESMDAIHLEQKIKSHDLTRKKELSAHRSGMPLPAPRKTGTPVRRGPAAAHTFADGNAPAPASAEDHRGV